MRRRAAAAALTALAWALPACGAPAGAAPSSTAAETLRLRGLRGAITATANTTEAIRASVHALMGELIARNRLQGERVVSATFTATADLDALFPASVARRLQGWESVALLDMQQLAVQGDLPRCIRVLLLVWMPASQPVEHVYLGEAARLRPDRARPQDGAAGAASGEGALPEATAGSTQ